MTAVTLKILHPESFEISRNLSDIFRIDEKFIQQLSAMCTCRDGKGGELSSRASKMLYKLPGAVYIASYKERLDQSDCWKLFVQLWNYTNYWYIDQY